SMSGEQRKTARLTEAGIEGDRIVQVQNDRGQIVTARTYPDLLGFKATLGRDGTPLVDGRPWTDPQISDAVQKIVGKGARLVRNDGLERFDILPLLIATDGAIAEFGRDGRRLRPNIIVGGVRGLEEREWQGRQLFIGAVVIRIHDLRSRCNMTTFDPDTLAHDMNVLR